MTRLIDAITFDTILMVDNHRTPAHVALRGIVVPSITSTRALEQRAARVVVGHVQAVLRSAGTTLTFESDDTHDSSGHLVGDIHAGGGDGPTLSQMLLALGLAKEMSTSAAWSSEELERMTRATGAT